MEDQDSVFREAVKNIADEVVENYLEKGMSMEDAVKEACPENFSEQFNIDQDWMRVWNHPSVCEKLSDYHGQDLMAKLKNRDAQNMIGLHMLAERTDDDRVEAKVRKYLAKAQGHTKTDELEITHKNQFADMGAEEMLEYLESIPGVNVEKEELIKGVFG